MRAKTTAGAAPAAAAICYICSMTGLRHFAVSLSILLAAAACPASGRAQSSANTQNPNSSQNPVTLAPAPVAIPQTPETAKAIAAATGFMNAIVRDSSVGNLMNLCGLPFCHDDSIVLTTRDQLRIALTQLISATSRERARTHPRVDTAYVMNVRKEALFGLVPINIYFTVVRLKFTVGGKDAFRLVILAVQLTDDAKVVGIED
ncbi:MAG TPA: hypothetical protein VGR89_11945 [Puia sp.]|nr:hypothetical protein [Puia sp.]